MASVDVLVVDMGSTRLFNQYLAYLVRAWEGAQWRSRSA